MIIKTWRDPYDAGFSPTKPKQIELKPGVTVLVGCNGAGKSTLLLNIQEHCKDNKIPCNLYDNLVNGGSNSISEMFYNNDYAEGAYLMSASEGECIKANLGRNSSLYKGFFESGLMNTRKNRLAMIFADDKNKVVNDFKNNKDRVLLFDAVDSGLSVDSIIEVKTMFDEIIKDIPNYNVNVYIVIAANEYELARNSDCFDVNAGKYIRFNDYEDYRKFIIKSRQNKEKRLKQQEIWRQKQREKALTTFTNLLETYKKNKDNFLSNVEDPNNLSWSDKYKLESLARPYTDFARRNHFITDTDVKELKTKILNE